MAGWRHQTYRLPQGHGWTARPGHRFFVADRGAALFEFPASWVVRPGSDSVEICDREPPDDSCVLAVSYRRLQDLDWSGLPLSRLLVEVVEDDEPEMIARGPVIEAARPGVELAWTEHRIIDANERREARSRICVARGSNVQSLITLDFWPEDEGRLSPVWDGVLSSLKLGLAIEDLARGRRSR